MNIKLVINFSPDVRYRVDNKVLCYFNSKQEMDNFLGILDRVSKKRYTYKWEEIETECEEECLK